ncbi:helix-turn-helix transcriptional regulator [Parvularcula maris]|uniref:Helix-turn-helix transcriptional regulator n=1 Tax=Parvularcula maris TaxID=2965077 RepID=A0A9X2L7R9_9PROT|nr:helix-turn-helix transcriptional regulator [Parvularcula maris]MCQ8184640.1 helix-turn-helix transcriptional regulator [Parvularcula maris]
MSVKLVREGEEYYEIGPKRLRLPAGALMILETEQPVIGGIRDQAAGLCLSLPPDASGARHSAGSAGWETGFVLRAEDTRLGLALQDLCDRALKGSGDADLPEGFGRWAEAHLLALTQHYALTAPLLGGAKAATGADRVNRASHARVFLADNRHRSVKLTEVAREVGVSPFQLARTFAAAFGETPMGFHRRLRLEAARAELRRGLSVTETSARLGFGSVRAFGRAYAAFFGCPPSEEPRGG